MGGCGLNAYASVCHVLLSRVHRDRCFEAFVDRLLSSAAGKPLYVQINSLG